jgi:hypothetical protein
MTGLMGSYRCVTLTMPHSKFRDVTFGRNVMKDCIRELQLADHVKTMRLNRIIKDSGLYTIVIPSTSPHPTLLKRRYEGMMNSSWIHILFQQYLSYGKEICI